MGKNSEVGLDVVYCFVSNTSNKLSSYFGQEVERKPSHCRYAGGYAGHTQLIAKCEYK